MLVKRRDIDAEASETRYLALTWTYPRPVCPRFITAIQVSAFYRVVRDWALNQPISPEYNSAFSTRNTTTFDPLDLNEWTTLAVSYFTASWVNSPAEPADALQCWLWVTMTRYSSLPRSRILAKTRRRLQHCTRLGFNDAVFQVDTPPYASSRQSYSNVDYWQRWKTLRLDNRERHSLRAASSMRIFQN